MANKHWDPLKLFIMALMVCLAASMTFALSAQAQSGRPDTRQMTCKQAQALVKKQGSVVLTTGSSTFERFVAHAGFCEVDENNLRAVYAPTKDSKKCAVGYRCFRNQTRN